LCGEYSKEGDSMGDFLRNWIVNITVIIIFIMFLDTVMPNDSLKRYVKVIIGLLIIISVIKPFVLVKDYAKGFDREFLETINYVENNRSTVNSEKISKYQMQKAVEIFEGNLKNQIIKIVKRNIKPELKNVTVDLEVERNFEREDFGNIKSVTISLTDYKGEVIEVDKIRIGVKEDAGENKNVINADKAEYNLSDSKIKSDIKDEISKTLGINESIISINVQK